MVLLAGGAWEIDELWRSDTNNNKRDKLYIAQQLACDRSRLGYTTAAGRWFHCPIRKKKKNETRTLIEIMDDKR